MGNAFENTFSQVKENEPKNVGIKTRQQPGIDTLESNANKKTTKQHVNKLSSQHVNKSTNKINPQDLNSWELERKTIYLQPDLAEMIKYAKFKKKMGESQIANLALESFFVQQFGKNWRSLLE